jgi:hypothetical protein
MDLKTFKTRLRLWWSGIKLKHKRFRPWIKGMLKWAVAALAVFMALIVRLYRERQMQAEQWRDTYHAEVDRHEDLRRQRREAENRSRAAEAEAAEAKARAAEAERRAREWRKPASAGGDQKANSAGEDKRFTHAKNVFASLYHPDHNMQKDDFVRIIRNEIWKEFWPVLERIERDGE